MPEKNIPDNKTGIPLAHYKAEYAEQDPQEVAERCKVIFHQDRGQFEVKMLGFVLYIAWPEFAITPADEAECPETLTKAQTQILIMRYLCHGVYEPYRDEYITYREAPWAQVYDANFQGRCIKRLAYSFDGHPELFDKAAEYLSALPFTGADAGCELTFLQDVHVRLKVWSGDDEFPPSSQILFSVNAPSSFSAEDLVVVGEITISALKECSKK